MKPPKDLFLISSKRLQQMKEEGIDGFTRQMNESTNAEAMLSLRQALLDVNAECMDDEGGEDTRRNSAAEVGELMKRRSTSIINEVMCGTLMLLNLCIYAFIRCINKLLGRTIRIAQL